MCVCSAHVLMQCLNICAVGTYACNDSMCMYCVYIYKMHANVFNGHIYATWTMMNAMHV